MKKNKSQRLVDLKCGKTFKTWTGTAFSLAHKSQNSHLWSYCTSIFKNLK